MTGLTQARQGQEIAIHARAVVSANPDFDTIALVDFPFKLKRHHFSFYQPDSTADRYLAGADGGFEAS